MFAISKKILAKLSKLSDLWYENFSENTRHGILLILPALMAVIFTSIGTRSFEMLSEHDVTNKIIVMWFVIWCGVSAVVTWLFALVLHDRHVLKEQTCLDYLTGVYSRRFLYEQATNLLRRASFDRKIICLCFVDVDNLKPINDGISHNAGDETLRMVGQTLDSVMRKKVDVVGRYGGDEFLAVWATDSEESIDITYKRIIDALSHMVLVVEGLKTKVTASTGLAFDRCSPKKSPEKELARLIRQADENLKKSKQHKS